MVRQVRQVYQATGRPLPGAEWTPRPDGALATFRRGKVSLEAEKRSPSVFVSISGVWIFNATLQDIEECFCSFSPFRVRGNWDQGRAC